MCGIAGFTAPGSDAPQILARMRDVLRHRGPDAAGTFLDDNVAIAHTRLAIVDLNGGAQPRVDETSGDVLAYNGEIYGYQGIAEELRTSGAQLRDHSDTEVLFHLIQRHGVRGAVDRIDGMFAFAFRDGATGALYLVRDRLGEKPLYYSCNNGRLVFGSEVTALRCHSAIGTTTLDPEAAYRFLLFEYLPGEESGWRGVFKLAPATILSFCDGKYATERYWQPRLGTPELRGISEEEAGHHLERLLLNSVKQRLVADVPVGVFLSGGIDSSLIAALAAETASNLTAFTVKFTDRSFDETPHATLVARHLGLRHEIVEISNQDYVEAFSAVSDKLSEPLGDSSLLPTYLVCRAARSVMKVALAGDGADELFAGYPNFSVQRTAPILRHMPPVLAKAFRRIASALPDRHTYMSWPYLARQLSQGFGAETRHQSFLWMAPFDPHSMEGLWRHSALPDDAYAEAFGPIDAQATEIGTTDPVESLLYLFLVNYLPEDILMKTDRASMFNSLEVRAPFLDRAISEYACGLPIGLKLKGRTKKYILKRLARNRLPETIIARPKHGFALPIGELIRTLLWDSCRDILLSRSNPIADWFNRAFIERLLAEHAARRRNHGKKLWALYVLFAVAKHTGSQYV